jgi:hypothetical protein
LVKHASPIRKDSHSRVPVAVTVTLRLQRIRRLLLTTGIVMAMSKVLIGLAPRSFIAVLRPPVRATL